MACIAISDESQAELVRVIYESVVAAAGDKERAIQLFIETIEPKGLGWLARILFNGIVKDVKPWHSGYNIEFTDVFATKHPQAS